MATVYIDKKVPARVLRASGASGERRPLCDLEAERFMGVLVHPVPALEMQDRIGAFRPGGKIFVYWPRDKWGWYSVKPGDQLEIEGRTYNILGILDHPSCFSQLYVDLA